MNSPHQPLVSVVLPTLNRTSLLPRSAGSVLSQSFTDLELIVVDDGSTEDVRAAVERLGDPRARCLRRDQRGGVAAARNTGVRAAGGRYLAFQDSDDEWLQGKLARQVEAVSAAGPGSMSVCGLSRVSPTHVRLYPGEAVPGSTLSHGQVLRHPFAYTQTWLVPRETVLDVGGFDESLRVWDDWELLIRLSARLRIVIQRETLVTSPMTGDGISAESDRFIHDIERIIDRHAATLSAPALAQLRYIQARLFGAAGRCPDVRVAAGHALRQSPSHWRAGALYALSFTGSTWLPRLLRRIGR